MALLTLQSVNKDFGIKEILRDASFSLSEGEKVGLIGTNGSGKSTLLKMISGLEPLDSGDLWINPKAKIIYLPQQPDVDEEKTVLEQVFADSTEQMSLIQEYERVSKQLAQGEGNETQLLSRLSKLTEQMDRSEAWDLETQAKIVLTQLGIEEFEARVGTLSGGYRKRIALATALLSTPDVLLMDEPTNHLDAASVEWLQTYLQRFQGALLLITHDRYFLDQVTNRILEIDRGDLYSYAGNYAYYLGKKAEAEEAASSSQQKHAGRLRRELEWLSRGPKARSTKQKARIDRIHEMQDQEFKTAQGKVDISTMGRRIGKKVVELSGVTKGYGNRILINDFTYLFSPDDRVGIIGKNGIGKSTFLNLITGRDKPDCGSIDIGSTIHFGYFDQHSDELNSHGNKRVIEYLKEVAELVKTKDGSVITASQMLERFLFPADQQYAPIHKLSGGEKRRLYLLQILIGAPNVLILDEPTNDLDVQTLAVLEEYLEDFNGCVIVVSHDRYFLDRTVETIFAFESEGNLRSYPGNYSIYLEMKKEQETNGSEPSLAKVKSKSSSQAPPAKSAGQSKKLTFKERKEYETLEERIPELEDEKTAIEQILYQNPPDQFEKLQELTDRLAALSQEIDTSTERWMELAERDKTT
jgi:ATP-binding cassette subfamily F protein uup